MGSNFTMLSRPTVLWAKLTTFISHEIDTDNFQGISNNHSIGSQIF